MSGRSAHCTVNSPRPPLSLVAASPDRYRWDSLPKVASPPTRRSAASRSPIIAAVLQSLYRANDTSVGTMISSGLVAEGSHSGLGAGTSAPMHFPPSHMSFEPFLKGGGGIPPVPEFLRPLPKPAPLVPRYNAPQPRPVSLVQHKEEPPEDTTFPSSIYNSRLFPPPPPPFSHYPGLQGPYGSLYPAHYTPYRDRPLPNPNPPLSPLEAYPGPQSPQYSPPAPAKPGQSLLKDKKFKVPSGKEGSLKHRILTRPDPKKKKPTVTIQTPPEVQTPVATNNNIPTPSFNKGSLIQLASGELRKVEDMRTEDFVSSAEKSPALRLDPSTVVRIDNSTAAKGFNLLTLSYGENRNQSSTLTEECGDPASPPFPSPPPLTLAVLYYGVQLIQRKKPLQSLTLFIVAEYRIMCPQPPIIAALAEDETLVCLRQRNPDGSGEA
ncbi:poly(G) binding [Homalodisca vitripennis]|nr:poly(G) binding [Homalodisca vitripennis]